MVQLGGWSLSPVSLPQARKDCMSTHINAYFMDVEEKQAAFDRASAELDAAEAALEAKKKEVGWVDPEPAEEELPEPAEPKSGNPFKKK